MGVAVYTLIALIIFVFLLIVLLRIKLSNNYKKSKLVIKNAQKKAEKLKEQKILEANNHIYRKEKERLRKISSRENELRKQENAYSNRVTRLEQKIDNFDKKENRIENLERKLHDKSIFIEKKEKKVDTIIKEQTQKLSDIAGYSKDQALKKLMDEILQKARDSVARRVGEIEQEIIDTAKERGAKILTESMQKIAVDYATDSVVNVVSLPNDEMKGRIIGREGRNIRTFEKETGVDVIVDDTPGAIVLSCFSAVRREIARHAMENLINDGRIHTARIEQVVKKSKQEIDKRIVNYGQKACTKMNVHSLSKNIINLIGKLHYRTSYGQNVLKHSMEVGWIAGMIAAELGLNQKLAKRAGFLHDIGKAMDYELDGTHAILGGNFARKNGENKIIVDAIMAHHEEVEPTNLYCTIVQISDSISGARPGARREMIESYVERLENLEKIANSIEGVKQTYAIQAGRELRVIVNPQKVKEDRCAFIVDDIIRRIENEMQYPGQIKVTVIRENRNSGVAK